MSTEEQVTIPRKQLIALESLLHVTIDIIQHIDTDDLGQLSEDLSKDLQILSASTAATWAACGTDYVTTLDERKEFSRDKVAGLLQIAYAVLGAQKEGSNDG